MYKYAIKEKRFYDFLLKIRSYFQKNDATIHKARNELKIIPYDGTETIVKSFAVPNIFRRLWYTFFRSSKAKKSYEYSLRIGDFTPAPIGYIEFYSMGLLKESFFIAHRFNYDFTIREPLLDPNFPDKKKILELFARFTYELHQNEILHKDYSPGNILIKKRNDTYIFKIVDINRMEFKPLSLNERLKNFAKLWIGDEDLQTVIQTYSVLVHEEFEKCYEIALKHSHALKAKVNAKKRLKGIEVVD